MVLFRDGSGLPLVNHMGATVVALPTTSHDIRASHFRLVAGASVMGGMPPHYGHGSLASRTRTLHLRLVVRGRGGHPSYVRPGSLPIPGLSRDFLHLLGLFSPLR